MDIPKASKTCSVSRRELKPGEAFFSVLIEENDGETKRLDIAAEHWTGPPQHCVGWWRTSNPETSDKKIKLAPNDILLDLFEQFSADLTKPEMRYVLALLLIRRRLFRYEREEETDETGEKTLVVYSIKQNMNYEIPVVHLTSGQLEDVQTQLASLLYC